MIIDYYLRDDISVIRRNELVEYLFSTGKPSRFLNGFHKMKISRNLKISKLIFEN